MMRIAGSRRSWFARLLLVLGAAAVLPACGSSGGSTPQIIVFAITNPSLPAGTVGTAYNAQLGTEAGTAPITWSIISGSLPPGLALGAATGAITGTPTGSANVSAFTVRAVDANGLVASTALSITITGGVAAGVSITTTTPLPGGDVNASYLFILSAAGGTPPYTWVVSAGALPTGLTLSTTGTLSGAVAAAGTTAFTVKATDSLGASATLPVSITFGAALSITTTSPMPAGTVGAAYNHSVVSAGGTAPILWTVTGGTLPAGLALNPATGAITGTPTAAAVSLFTVQAVDAIGASVSVTLSITINVAPSITTATPLTPWTQGLAGYSQTLAATGGTGADTFAVTAGALPAGMSLSAAGVLTGTPSAAGTASFTVTVTDAVGGTGTKAFNLTINAPVAVTTALLSAWTINQAGYSQTLASTGGTGAITWSVSVGTLPTGITLTAATGLLSGTPTVAGTSNFTVKATDSLGASGTAALQIVINADPTVTTASTPNWTQGLAFASLTFTESNGTSPFGWSSTGGLPPGLTLSAAGVLSGTPTTAGTYHFNAVVTDLAGATNSKAFTIVVAPPLAVTNTIPLAAWTQNAAGYSQTMTSTGGTGATTWSVTVGALPATLSLVGSTGAITGTPTAAPGTVSFTMTVTDSVGATATQATSIKINAPIAFTNANPLAAWTQGVAGYSQTATTNGGTGAITYSISAGGLPPGLTLTANTGAISGNPTTASGTPYAFTLKATDTVGATATQANSITINSPLAITNPTPLPAWTQGIAGYSYTMTATGGTGAQTWSVSSGALPAPMAIAGATGVISGTPASGPSNYAVIIKVVDSVGASTTQSTSLQLNAPVTITNLIPLPQGNAGSPYSVTLTETGGTGAITWSFNSGSLPTNLNLVGNQITGTPSVGGTFSFTLKAMDSTGSTFSQPTSIFILAPLTANTPPLAGGVVGTSYGGGPLSATGGTTPYAWTKASGTLPGGVNFNGAGVFSGTVTGANGVYNFTVMVTDSGNRTATQPLSITVSGGAASGITVVTTTLPTGAVGATYNAGLTATGGNPPYTWSISAGALPAGVILTPSTGALSGTPTTSGSGSVTFGVTDGTNNATSGSIPWTINPAVSLTSATPLPQWTANAPNAYNFTLAVSGGVPPFTFSQSGSLPPGLALTPTGGSAGLISGNPTATGTFSFTAQVNDSAGGVASKGYSITINGAPSVSTASLPQGTVGVSYPGASVLQVTGGAGTPPFTWSVTSGALPAGINPLGGGNSITGTPTASVNNSQIGFTVTDAAGAQANKTLGLTINPAPAITTTSPLTSGTEGVAYNVTFANSGGTGPFTWSMTGGALPTGLTFNGGSSGSITGTPAVGTAAGSPYSVTIKVQDSLGASASSVFSLSISNGPKVSIANPAGTSPLVNPDTNLVLTFNMAMVKAQVQANFSLSGVSASAVHTYVWDTPSGSPNGTTLTVVFDTAAPFGQITADDLLADNTVYTWTIAAGAQSGTGLTMPLQTGQFQTQFDSTAPQIVSIVSATNPSQNINSSVLTGSVTGLTVTFNEGMNTSTGNNGASVQIQGGSDQRNASAGTTTGTMTVQWTNSTTLAIGFNPALTANTGYQLQFNGLSDADNNYINNNPQYSILTAGSGVAAPVVIGSYPQNNAVGVNRDTGIFIATNEDLSPNVQTLLTVTGVGVPAVSVSYRVGKSNGPTGVQIYPATAWPANTLITLTIPGGAGNVTNASLVPLAATYVLKFTTGATGASSGAISINAPFSTIQNPMTDCDTFNFQGAVAFKDGAGNPVYFNVATLTNAAISVVDSAGIPCKNLTVGSNQGGGGDNDPGRQFLINNRNGQWVTSMEQGMTYTLTFNSSIQSSTGGAFTATPYTFTTVASGNVLTRTMIYNGNNSQCQTTSGPPNPTYTFNLQVDPNINNNGSNISNVANASAGTTAYTVGNLQGWVIGGASVGVYGCNNSVNNGVFTVASVSGSGPFTLTLDNASGVAETPPNNAFVGSPLTVNVSDITGGTNTFATALTYNNGNNNQGFQYSSSGNESTVTSSGVHTLKFTVADGIASHTYSFNQLFYFFTAADMSAMTLTAPSGAGPFGGTPTYTWSGTQPADATALLLAVQAPNGGPSFEWVFPGTPGTFTQPANTPLPALAAGQQYSWTVGYYHSFDGTIRDNGEMGIISPALKFTR